MLRIRQKEAAQFVLIITGLTLASAGLAFSVPYAGAAYEAMLREHAVTVGILYAIIIGFFMSITIKRKYALDEYISLELNKIRRIYHLGLHIARAEPKLGAWFERVRDAIAEYQVFFRKQHFSRYDDANPIFRKVTYAIYELPQFGLPYNKELYYSLLETAASATEAREHIREKRSEAIALSQAGVLFVVTLTFSIFVASATAPVFAARFAAAAVIFNIFLTLILLFRYDRSYGRQNVDVNRVYAKNLAFAEED